MRKFNWGKRLLPREYIMYWKKIFIRTLLILLMSGLIGELTEMLFWQGRIRNLSLQSAETSVFREMELSQETLEGMLETHAATAIPIGELLSVWMPQQMFSFTDVQDLSKDNFKKWEESYKAYRPEAYRLLKDAYTAVWDDIRYYPTTEQAVFENSWMFERNYGGKRGHEGVDLMPPENISGYYPVFSMTEGTVEQVGWLEQGGYRIGIRSPHGGYFYYAHLESYAQNFEPGDTVRAGTLLGYMGDSGYGPVGTRGKFDVHLHLGIYIKTRHYEELSVNPYWVLQLAKEQKLKYRGDLCYNHDKNM